MLSVKIGRLMLIAVWIIIAVYLEHLCKVFNFHKKDLFSSLFSDQVTVKVVFL